MADRLHGVLLAKERYDHRLLERKPAVLENMRIVQTIAGAHRHNFSSHLSFDHYRPGLFCFLYKLASFIYFLAHVPPFWRSRTGSVPMFFVFPLYNIVFQIFPLGSSPANKSTSSGVTAKSVITSDLND